MNNYLAEILKEVNTLIIPNFGALTVTNSSTGEVMFMPYLKYDDGKLVKFISEKESVSEEEAKSIIAKYIGEIEAKLNSGEKFEMAPLGTFSKDKAGDIEFVSNALDQDTSDEVIPVKAEETKFVEQEIEEETSINEEPEIIPIVVPEEAIPTQEDINLETEPIEIIANDDSEIILEDTVESEYLDEPEVAQESELIEDEYIESTSSEDAIIAEAEAGTIDESNKIILVETEVNEVLEEPDHTIEKEEVIAVATTYTEEDQWKDDLDLPPLNAKIERPKKAILEKTQKDKKRRRPAFYILLVLVVLILAGTLTVAMFYNSFEKMLPFLSKHPTEEVTPDKEKVTSRPLDKLEDREPRGPKETKEEVAEETEEKTVVAEEEPVKETPIAQRPEAINDSETIQTSTGQVNRSKPFHIIGGAFSDKSNADRYQSKLISGGNTSVIIGKFDQLYIVSIASYGTKAEAETALTTSKGVSPNAWIFQWP